MSQKTEKRLRRVAKKTYLYHYKEFLEDVCKLGLWDRYKIAWQVIIKGKFMKDD